MTAILQIERVSKSFPGVKALDSVSLSVASGEILALVGENGAGKSTLMKILAGIHRPDSGTIRIEDQAVVLRSPRDAAGYRIAVIHQELELIDTLDVAANVFLGREPTWGGPAKLLDSRRIWLEADKILARLGSPFSSRMRVSELSLAHKQMVEIARALSLNARIILMDEPTSSLTTGETERLLSLIEELKRDRVSIIYISHRLAEVQRVADRVVVLRDGKNAGELRDSEITHDRMIQLMVGRDLKAPAPDAGMPSGHRQVSFEIQKFRTTAYPNEEVSIAVHEGEILGIAGLVGAGRSELARAIFGVEKALSGTVATSGTALSIKSAHDAIDYGIYLVPEDRRELGLITGMTVKENITLPSLRRHTVNGLIRNTRETDAAKQSCEALHIKTPTIDTRVENLSGGNQQKVVLAKWLSMSPKLIVFDEPTRGIDVGAKSEIYNIMRSLADQGVAIMMISSDMEEILANSDRVAVMREGRVTGILDRSECTEEAIMRLAVA